MPVPNNPFVRLRLRSISKHTLLLRFAIAALLVIIPSIYFLNNTTPATAGSCAQDPSNLLLNGTMAPGPANQYGVVSAHWSAFVLGSNVPHFENAANEGWDPNGSQYIWTDKTPFDAGILQTVRNLKSGQTYHFWIVWCQSLQDVGGGNNKRTNQIDRQIGVDLTGGTNPNARTVQWTVPYKGGSGFNRKEWNLYFKAPGTTATFFLRGINYLTTGRDKVFFDTACLFAAAGSPTTTPWATVRAAGTPTPTATRTPTPTATSVGSPPIAPTPADPSVIWDARLPALNVSLQPANVAPGTLYWKLIRAEYDDPYQHCGDFGADHDMFFVITNQTGGRVVNQHVWQGWPDGATDAYSDTRGIADIAIWSNYDPGSGPGPYFGWVDGLPSDVVTGMGLPLKHHVSFVLYFQKTIAAPYPARTPTPSGPWMSPTPTLTPTPACRISSTVTPTRVGGSTATPTPINPPSATPASTSTPTATAPPAACAIKSVATISVGARPKGVAVDPGTNRIFVGLANSSSVAVIDGSSKKLVATWTTDGLGNSNGVAFAQNEVFVTKRNNASVSVINATTGTFVKNISVGNAPYGIGASGANVWVANFSDGTVSLINAMTNTRIKTTTVGGFPSLIAPFNNRAYVTTFGAGVSDVDGSNNVLHAIASGDGTFGVAANPQTNRVYTSNRNTNAVVVIDAIGDTISATKAESGTPYALAVNPNTNHLFILLADSNSLRVRDAATWNVVANVPVGAQGSSGGDGIGILNNNVYVANNSAGTVSVIADCAGQ
jgi:YVTN family beta-propeller protein